MYRPPPPPPPAYRLDAQFTRTANTPRPLYRPQTKQQQQHSTTVLAPTPLQQLTPVQAIRAAAPYPRLFAAELAARVAAAAEFAWARQQEEEEEQRRREEEQRQAELMHVAQVAAAAAVADQRRIQQTVRMQLQQEADERAHYTQAIAAQSFTPIVTRPLSEQQLRATATSPALASPRVPPHVANRQQQPRGSPIDTVPQPQLLPEPSPVPFPAQVQSPRQLHSPSLQLPSRQRRTVSAPVVANTLLSAPAVPAAPAVSEPPVLQPLLQQASPAPASLSTSQPLVQALTSPAARPAIAPASLSTTAPIVSAVSVPVQRYRPPPTLLLPSRLRAAAAAIADAAAASQAATAAASSSVAVAPVAALSAAPAAVATPSPALPSTPAQAASRMPPAVASAAAPTEPLNRSVESFSLFAAPLAAASTPAAALQPPRVHPLLQQTQQDNEDDLDFASPAPSAASRSAQQLPPASMPLHSLSTTADTPASSTSLLSMSQPLLLSATAPASSLPTQTPSNEELASLFFGGLDSDEETEESASIAPDVPQRTESMASTTAGSLVNTIASTAPASLTSSAASRASSSASSSLVPRSTTSSMDSLSSSLSPTRPSAALNSSVRAGPVPSVPAVNDGLTPASSAAVILEKLERNLWGTIRSIERSDSMLANLFPTERDREGAEEEDAAGSESDSSRSSYEANHSKRLDRTQPISETVGDASPVSQLLDMRSPGSLSSTGSSSIAARPRPSAATADFIRQHGTPEQKREQESLDDLDRQMHEQEEELRHFQQNFGEILRRHDVPHNAQRTHRRPRSSGSSSNVEVQASLVDEWPALQAVASAVSDRDRSDHSVRSSRRSSTQSYTPDVFFASHPNLPPNSPFHHVLNSSGQFSVADDDETDAATTAAAATGGEDALHQRLDFVSSDARVSPSARAPSHHRRLESADVLAEFERTIRVRGLDEDRKSASPASAASFSRTIPRNAEQPENQWALQSASRRSHSSDLDSGFSAPIIMLATRSTDQPIVLYLDKVQQDGTIMRLCIHQHDNSQQLATLYLRCLSLPTTAEYTAPLSALIQRKISAFVASVKHERQSMERLIESLRHKLNAEPDDRVAVMRKPKLPTNKKKVKRKIKMGEVSLKTVPVRQRSPSPPQRGFGGRHFSLSPPRRPTQLSSSLLVGMSPKNGTMKVGRAPVPLLLPPLMHPLPLPQPIRTSRSRKRAAAPATLGPRSASAPRRS